MFVREGMWSQAAASELGGGVGGGAGAALQARQPPCPPHLLTAPSVTAFPPHGLPSVLGTPRAYSCPRAFARADPPTFLRVVPYHLSLGSGVTSPDMYHFLAT